ncbi:MAG: DUF1566 domain-containing protein [Bacteroides sp.]|nr:DUF1566 domain-containing protein [Bacteroides sp.]MCM1086171.1 DUF1566 domain-containing protein [Bacteroides sp.]
MKKILHTTLTIGVCLLATLLASCKDKEKEKLPGSIYGTVSIAGTDEPMRGTGVALHYTTGDNALGALFLRTVTASDGYYEFPDVIAGEYILRVEVPEYKITQYNVIVESGRAARADMQVTPKGEGDDETEDVYIIKAAKLMVQKQDLGEGDWSTADVMCKSSTLAGYTDWRLPTKEELMTLYTNKSSIGEFGDWIYWSCDRSDQSAVAIDFRNGYIYNDYRLSNIFCVRAVRSINNDPEDPEEPEEDYITIPELNLMVQKQDIGVQSFSSAEALCAASIIGAFRDWRLPTINELQTLYINRSIIGNFQEEYIYTGTSSRPYAYWSSTPVDSSSNDTYYAVEFDNGETVAYSAYYPKLSVRAVRTISQ